MSLTPELSDVASIREDVIVRRMVALFDYDPWENSPNMDSEVSASNVKLTTYFCILLIYRGVFNPKMNFLGFQVELGFRSGDIIYVLGDMDQDGFYFVCTNSAVTLWLISNLMFAQKFISLSLSLFLKGRSSRKTRFGSLELPATLTLELDTVLTPLLLIPSHIHNQISSFYWENVNMSNICVYFYFI